MTDTIRVGESGKRHRINCKFDMTSNTSLAIVYTKPSGAVLTVVGVLGGTPETIDGLAVLASYWMYFDFTPGDVDEAGDWQVEVTYTNTASTPDDVFKNLDPIVLVVGD